MTTMVNPFREAALGVLVDSIGPYYQSVYVDYDSRFSDEQMRALFGGDPALETFDELIAEWLDECRNVDAANQTGIWSDEQWEQIEDFDLHDDIYEALSECDTSNPVAELIRVHPREFMFYTLGEPVVDNLTTVESRMFEWGRAAGFTAEQFEGNVSALRELDNEVGYRYCGLSFFWYDRPPVEEQVGMLAGQFTAGVLTWEGPWLLAFDPNTGFGHEVRLTGMFRAPFEPARLRMDRLRPWGWSRDGAAGLAPSGYTDSGPRFDLRPLSN